MEYNDMEQQPTVERMKELLVGKTIVEVKLVEESPYPHTQGPTGILTLSDGTTLKLWGNDGGCACDAGCYPLKELNPVSGIITNVEIEDAPDDDGALCPICNKKYCTDEEHGGYYKIFVVTTDERVTLASFVGSDGSGYYGTGWWMYVEKEK